MRNRERVWFKLPSGGDAFVASDMVDHVVSGFSEGQSAIYLKGQASPLTVTGEAKATYLLLFPDLPTEACEARP